MLIRDYENTDWPSIWPIFQEIVTAGETYAYDPEWSSEQAKDVWVEPPPDTLSWRAKIRTFSERRTWDQIVRAVVLT